MVFLFAGDDGDCVNAGRTLFESAPGFRAILEQCDARLRPYLDSPLLSVLFPEPGAALPLDDSYARPARFAIAYALAELWRSWGIVPALVVGRGLGEIAAATVARMMSLEEGLMLATRRGDEFARQLSHVSFKAPAIALFSTRSLKTVTADDLSDPSSWSYDANGGGQLDAAIASLAEQGHQIFVEAGPAFVLSDRLQKLLLPRAGACLSSLRRGRNDWEQMIETLAALYERGVNVDWDSFYRHDVARKVALPTYPFSPRKFWLEPGKTPEKPQSADAPELWNTVVAAAEQQSRQAPMDLALYTYEAKWQSLDRLTTVYMMRTLRELGAFAAAREPHTVDTLLKLCGVLPTYKVLMARWLKKLAGEGWLQRSDENYFAAESRREPSYRRTPARGEGTAGRHSVHIGIFGALRRDSRSGVDRQGERARDAVSRRQRRFRGKALRALVLLALFQRNRTRRRRERRPKPARSAVALPRDRRRHRWHQRVNPARLASRPGALFLYRRFRILLQSRRRKISQLPVCALRSPGRRKKSRGTRIPRAGFQRRRSRQCAPRDARRSRVDQADHVAPRPRRNTSRI